MTNETLTTAAEGWIATDSEAVRQDVRRLGLEGAADYQLELARESAERGDARWAPLCEADEEAATAAMLSALTGAGEHQHLRGDGRAYGINECVICDCELPPARDE